MLDANDVRVLEKMFDQKLGELRDEMHQEFVKVRGEIAKGFEMVRDDIIDVIDQSI